MQPLPTVITTSVVRSAHQGESHGGIYLVDLESGKATQKTDWNNCNIDWKGRGGDRGLRGIAFHGQGIYVAASDEIIIYDTEFNIQRTLRNHYLRYCHEVFIHGDRLYLSSTGFDSILVFDINANRFISSYCIRVQSDRSLSVSGFDPNSPSGPAAGDTLHLNNVYVNSEGLQVSGHQLPFIVIIDDKGFRGYGKLPPGTHNARLLGQNLLFNDTGSNRIALTNSDGKLIRAFAITPYKEDSLQHNDLPNDHARQGFCRGLCLANSDSLLIGGSSPSTISAYSLEHGERLRQVNLSMDKRNAIHGLEVWPFTDNN